jgi:hypothetical protein
MKLTLSNTPPLAEIASFVQDESREEAMKEDG